MFSQMFSMQTWWRRVLHAFVKEPFSAYDEPGQPLQGRRPYLSVMHVTSNAQILIDGRGLPSDTAIILEPLQRNGIRIIDDGDGADLAISDMLTLDMSRQIVACALYSSHHGDACRALYLFGSMKPGAPQSLKELIAARDGHQVMCRASSERQALSFACNAVSIDPATVHVTSTTTQPSTKAFAVALWATKDEARAYARSNESILLFSGAPSLLSYDPDNEPRRRAAVAPMLSVININVGDVLPKVTSAQKKQIATLLSAPLVLTGSPELEHDDGRTRLLRLLATSLLSADMNAVAINNYYATRFQSQIVLYDATSAVLKSLNADVMASTMKSPAMNGSDISVGRPDKPVLEQFVEQDAPPINDEVTIETANDVQGSYRLHPRDRKRREFFISTVRLEGVPLHRGDRVIMRTQYRADENGAYFVVDVTPGKGALLESPAVVTFAQPKVDKSNNDGRWRFRVPRVTSRALVLKPGDRVVLEAVDGAHGEVIEVSVGEAMVLLDKAKNVEDVDDKFHPLSLCSVDPLVPVRELCMQRGGVWDRPCERDDDCPFFQAAPMSMTRGGCDKSGFCELPIGVQNAGYRHYISGAATRPICQGGPPSSTARNWQGCDFVF